MNPKSHLRLALSITGVALAALGQPSKLCADTFQPLNTPASTEHHQGKLVWADLFTSDPEGATKFYCDLLGWTATTVDQKGKPYTVFSNDGRPVAGLAPHSAASAKHLSKWIGYLAVDDINVSVAAAQKDGAVVHAPVRKFPDRGHQAIIGDIEGVPVGLLQSSSGDSADTEPRTGDWNWFEIYVHSPKSVANFYKDALNYDVTEDNRGNTKNEYMLASGGLNRGGIAQVPDGDDVRPSWLGVIRVTDLDLMLTRVAGLGGTVLVQPRSVEFGSRFAIILDPTGGTVGLVQYLDDANPANAKTP
jgi:predicted enzyme related to lactoylglutathione lyase